LLYPAEQEARILPSGETLKFNTEITDGAPAITYNEGTGSFRIVNPGKYVVFYLLHALELSCGKKTQLQLLLDGKKVVSHDIIPNPYLGVPFTFTDIIQVTQANAELCLVNSGFDLIFNPLAETVANIALWGLVPK
jgi:hypothetical protein